MGETVEARDATRPESRYINFDILLLSKFQFLLSPRSTFSLLTRDFTIIIIITNIR